MTCTALGACQLFPDVPPPDPHAVLAQIVTERAEQHAVPPQLAKAVIQHESGWRPDIRGAAGEYGLMQIKCPTARGEGFRGSCRELFDPTTNAEYGVRYLRRALELTNWDWCGATTLYNRGLRSTRTHSQYCNAVLAKVAK